MARKAGTGGVRTVIQLSPENYIFVNTKLTPSGEDKPLFGHISRYFNALVEADRARDALKEPTK